MSNGPEPPPSPCLFWKDKGRSQFDYYDDTHSTEDIVHYLEKQLSPPMAQLKR